MEHFKLVLLIISSRGAIYDKMKEIQRNFLKNFDVTYFFIENDPTIKKNVILNGDVLTFKNNEDYIPGISIKTIESMEYVLENIDFDLIIRTNLSTLFDIPKTIKKFRDIKNIEKYYGGHCGCITISENFIKKYYNSYKYYYNDNISCGSIIKFISSKVSGDMLFVGGTHIAMGKDIVKYIVKCYNDSKKIINYFIDDVLIGILININKSIIIDQTKLENMRMDFYGDIDPTQNIIVPENVYCFRYKHNKDRNKDVEYMNIISNKILKSYKINTK